MAKISSRQRAKCVRIHNRVLKKGYYARMFDPADLDKVCVQATHLEERGKFNKEEKRKKLLILIIMKKIRETRKTHLLHKNKIQKMFALIVKNKVI